jgi:hypothetical protein
MAGPSKGRGGARVPIVPEAEHISHGRLEDDQRARGGPRFVATGDFKRLKHRRS